MKINVVPYDIAISLKKLKFDNENYHCFYGYQDDFLTLEKNNNKPGLYFFGESSNNWNDISYNCNAPTFDIVFKWFREKHHLNGEIYTVDMGCIEYTFLIRDLYSENIVYDNFEANTGGYTGTFDTHELAELVCLNKLINLKTNEQIEC